MKPYIIIADESGKPIMSAQEVQDLIQAAYVEGYKDGQKQNPTITVPTYDPPKNKDWWDQVRYTKDITTAPYNPEAYKVYCSNAGGTNSVR